MDKQQTYLHDILKKNRKSITRQRMLVFEVLRTQGSVTHRDIENTLSTSIDRASIYRVVSLFEKLGIVRRVYTGWKYSLELSEIFNPHHHHLHCTECGKIIDIKEPVALAEILSDIEKTHSFSISSHQFELSGQCQKCRT